MLHLGVWKAFPACHGHGLLFVSFLFFLKGKKNSNLVMTLVCLHKPPSQGFLGLMYGLM